MRVLIDSSVWIDHLRGVRTRETAILGMLLAWLDPELERGDHEATADILVGDLILCEVLRGIPDPREHAAVKDALLSFEVVTIGGVDLALAAADQYRALRRLGVSVRKTIDLLIGTYCVANDCALLHRGSNGAAPRSACALKLAEHPDPAVSGSGAAQTP